MFGLCWVLIGNTHGEVLIGWVEFGGETLTFHGVKMVKKLFWAVYNRLQY